MKRYGDFCVLQRLRFIFLEQILFLLYLQYLESVIFKNTKTKFSTTGVRYPDSRCAGSRCKFRTASTEFKHKSKFLVHLLCGTSKCVEVPQSRCTAVQPYVSVVLVLYKVLQSSSEEVLNLVLRSTSAPEGTFFF